MLELAECLFGQGKHEEAFTAVHEARLIVAEFALPADAVWRRAMHAWLGRAQELGRPDAATWLAAEVQRLADVPDQRITASERLRIRPANR